MGIALLVVTPTDDEGAADHDNMRPSAGFRPRRGSRWRDCELELKSVVVCLVPGGKAFPPPSSALIPAFCLSLVACRTDGARRKWLNGFHRYFCAASMPIRPYLDGQKFDPETIRVMGIAFEMALVALRHADRGDLANEVVARQIINLAKAGERDPERLCEAMMKEFRAPPQV